MFSVQQPEISYNYIPNNNNESISVGKLKEDPKMKLHQNETQTISNHLENTHTFDEYSFSQSFINDDNVQKLSSDIDSTEIYDDLNGDNNNNLKIPLNTSTPVNVNSIRSNKKNWQFKSKWNVGRNKRSVSLINLSKRPIDFSEEVDIFKQNNGMGDDLVPNTNNYYEYKDHTGNSYNGGADDNIYDDFNNKELAHSKRSYKDIRTILQQDEHISYIEEKVVNLTSRCNDLQNEVIRLEKENRLLKDSDSQKISHIEDIEHHLELSTQELYQRRKIFESKPKSKHQFNLQETSNANTGEKISGDELIDTLFNENGTNNHKPKPIHINGSVCDASIEPQLLESPKNGSSKVLNKLEKHLDWLSLDTKTLNFLKETCNTNSQSLLDTINKLQNEIETLKNEVLNRSKEVQMLKLQLDHPQSQSSKLITGQLKLPLMNELKRISENMLFNTSVSLSLPVDTEGNIDLNDFLERVLPIAKEQGVYINNLLNPQDNTPNRSILDNGINDTDEPISKNLLKLLNKEQEENIRTSNSFSSFPITVFTFVILLIPIFIGSIFFSFRYRTLMGRESMELKIGNVLENPMSLNNDNNIILGQTTNKVWWQRFGNTLEYWGSEVDRKARPNNQKQPV